MGVRCCWVEELLVLPAAHATDEQPPACGAAWCAKRGCARCGGGEPGEYRVGVDRVLAGMRADPPDADGLAARVLARLDAQGLTPDRAQPTVGRS